MDWNLPSPQQGHNFGLVHSHKIYDVECYLYCRMHKNAFVSWAPYWSAGGAYSAPQTTRLSGEGKSNKDSGGMQGNLDGKDTHHFPTIYNSG